MVDTQKKHRRATLNTLYVTLSLYGHDVAKSAIESFYGLDELEVDDDKADKRNKNDSTMLDNEEDDNDESAAATFDMEYVLKFLADEKVVDLCCIRLPAEANYADHMIIGTCLADRHISSVFIELNKRYKRLKDDNNIVLKRRLADDKKWCAIDVGSMVVHLFLEEYREFYDLESLWTCGAEFDEKCIDFLASKKEMEKKLIVADDDA